MPIPDNINREHIFRAIIRVINEGVPPHRNMINRALEYDGNLYPIKLIISWANVYPNNEELDNDPNVFTTNSGQVYLENLGFTVVHL